MSATFCKVLKGTFKIYGAITFLLSKSSYHKQSRTIAVRKIDKSLSIAILMKFFFDLRSFILAIGLNVFVW